MSESMNQHSPYQGHDGQHSFMASPSTRDRTWGTTRNRFQLIQRACRVQNRTPSRSRTLGTSPYLSPFIISMGSKRVKFLLLLDLRWTGPPIFMFYPASPASPWNKLQFLWVLKATTIDTRLLIHRGRPPATWNRTSNKLSRF